MNFNNGPGGYHLPPDLPSARLPVEDQGVWGGALGQGYEGHPGDHEERGGVRGGGVGPGRYAYHPFCLLLLLTFLEKIMVFGVVPLVKLTWAILEIMGKGVVLEEEVL